MKNYSINRNDLKAYYNVGKMLSEAGRHYGEGIIKEYSKRLTHDLGKGYSKRNLWLMIRFYFLQEKVRLNEYKINIDGRYNYINLLLYNIKYKCYVVVELKMTELKKEHTGQIMIYMNYIDNNIKTVNENNTVGIIICKYNNEYVIKYCSDDRIISREYIII